MANKSNVACAPSLQGGKVRRLLLVGFAPLFAVVLAVATVKAAQAATGPHVIATITSVTDPFALAVNPHTDLLYVTNLSDISVISGVANTLTTTVSVGRTPYNVAVNTTTNTIYVPNETSNSLSVISGATNTVTATVNVGTEPFSVGVNPKTNRVYVANSLDNTVSVINGATNSVVATVSVGTDPYNIGIDPTTYHIYVSNHSGSKSKHLDCCRTSKVTATGFNFGLKVPWSPQLAKRCC
jgi:YVTN family beta-propeller protein